MRIRIKMCGMTRPEDVRLAEQLGVDAIGLIFVPSSKRVITPAQARTLSSAVGPGVARVGVFVDAPLNEVLRTADHARLSALQLHGHESEGYLLELARFYPVIRALRVQALEDLPGQDAPHTLLLDGVRPGSGHALDWDALERHLRARPLPSGWMLAGGLSPDNVAEAVRRFAPLGLGWVDAVSGLEAAHGRKDPDRMQKFMTQVAQIPRLS